MAKRAGTRMQSLLTVAGTATCIGALAVLIAPRISISRSEDATIIKYNHLKCYLTHVALKPKQRGTGPADKGLIITPAPKPSSSLATSTLQKPFSEEDWILDTGATTHVCTNRALMHSYKALDLHNNRFTPKPVGFFGPNPAPIIGTGDCTLTLPSLSQSDAPVAADSTAVVVNFITIKHVNHIPAAGLNLISWSQLKRAKGLDLRLVEDADGSLTVRNQNQPVMRFEPRHGLYFLVQLPSPVEVGSPANG